MWEGGGEEEEEKNTQETIFSDYTQQTLNVYYLALFRKDLLSPTYRNIAEYSSHSITASCQKNIRS